MYNLSEDEKLLLKTVEAGTGRSAWVEHVEQHDGFRLYHVYADTSMGAVGSCGCSVAEAVEAVMGSLKRRGLWRGELLS